MVWYNRQNKERRVYMKCIMKIFIIAFLALAALSTVALADDSPMGRCTMMCAHEKMWSKMDLDDMLFFKIHFVLANAADIGLSDDQAEKIKALKYSVKKGLIKNDADIESIALDIKEELRKDVIDTNAVNGLIDKKYAVKAQKAKDLVGAYANLKTILTKEQIKKAKDLMTGCMGEKGKHMMMEEKEEHEMHGKGMHK
jgi:Spy/CpxP family protein refolding chaperone